jgi:prevent-host-death family protein
MPTDIISLTEFKNDASGWIERLQHQPPVVLTQNGRGKAVVQSYESYRQMQLELALLKRLSLAQTDLKAGRTKTTEEVFEQARKRLKKRLADRA